MSQQGSLVNVQGSSEYPLCSGASPGFCVFQKGTSGWYYISPNQGGGPGNPRKILKLKFLNAGAIPAATRFFTYNVSTNTWQNTGGATTGTYFQWSQVTSSPSPINC